MWKGKFTYISTTKKLRIESSAWLCTLARVTARCSLWLVARSPVPCSPSPKSSSRKEKKINHQLARRQPSVARSLARPTLPSMLGLPLARFNTHTTVGASSPVGDSGQPLPSRIAQLHVWATVRIRNPSVEPSLTNDLCKCTDTVVAFTWRVLNIVSAGKRVSQLRTNLTIKGEWVGNISYGWEKI